MTASKGTLQITPAVLKTPVVMLLIWATLFAFAEWIVRQPVVQAQLPVPSIGSLNPDLEIRWDQFEKTIAATDGFDCVFVGSSLPRSAINPEVFSRAYAQTTGQEVHCFNFGIPGLDAQSSSYLAKILAEKYHVKLIIFITQGLDFRTRDLAESIINLPFVQYQLGYKTPKGWLINYSYLYRYYLRTQGLLNLQDQPALQASLLRYYLVHHVAVSGYDATMGVNPEIDFSGAPDPQKEAAYLDLLSDTEFSPSQVQSLENFTDLQQDTGSQVLVVEAPLHPTFALYLREGQSEYEQVQHTLAQYVLAQNLIYWPADQLPMFPAGDWYDRVHLNNVGADAFSTWLGNKVGETVNSGSLRAFNR